MAQPDAPRLSLKPTELQPHEGPQSSPSALEELREEIVELGRLEPAEPMFSVHLTLALQKVARRLDHIYSELGL